VSPWSKPDRYRGAVGEQRLQQAIVTSVFRVPVVESEMDRVTVRREDPDRLRVVTQISGVE
jgi:hypothetical protein